MPSIRWSKSSGRNGGSPGHGGRGRKCEKTDGKDAVKCKEGVGIKRRGLFRSRCVKSPVIDALVEVKSKPTPTSSSLQELGVIKKINSCDKNVDGKSPVIDVSVKIKSKPNPNSTSLQEVGVIKKSDSCEKGVYAECREKADDARVKIRSEPNPSSKSLQEVGVIKKSDSCEKGVYAECREKADGLTFKCKGNWHSKCVLEVKQGMQDNQCMEDVKLAMWDNECVEDVKQGIWDSAGMELGIQHSECMVNEKHGTHNNGCMTHVERDGVYMDREKRADSSYKGGDAVCTDNTKAVVYDKAGDADADSMLNETGEVSTQTKVITGLNSNSMRDVSRKVCFAGIENEGALYEKNVDASCFAESAVMVPQDFVCKISKKVMEDPVVVASGQTFERACIQAWLDEGHTLCPVTHKPLSHLQLIPNVTLKMLISTWLSSQSCHTCPETAHHSFSSCTSSFPSCPSLTTPHHQSFISSSSFSVSKLLKDTGLYSFSSSSSSSSLPKLLLDAELDSFSSGSVSACSYGTPDHLRVGNIFNFPSTPSSSGGSSCWEKEGEVCPLQENEVLHASQRVDSTQERQGEDDTAMSKMSQICNLHSKSNDPIQQSTKAGTYIVSRINSLVSDLDSKYVDIQKSAAAELRLLAKHADENRLLIVSAGALRPLVTLLLSRDESIQLEATTTLLNLSLNHALKDHILKEGAIEALVRVLRDGLSAGAKENAAITFACLAVGDASKTKIGSDGAVAPLVDLLGRGSPRGKKDAAAALYRLSSIDGNKRRIVRAGAARLLVDFMSDQGDKDGMVDKAIAILGNLVSIEEGRVAFVEEGGIMSLMQVIQEGSQRSQRLAVPILFQLCTHSRKHRSLVLQKEPLPTLMALSKTGNLRLKTQVTEVIQALIVDTYA